MMISKRQTQFKWVDSHKTVHYASAYICPNAKILMPKKTSTMFEDPTADLLDFSADKEDELLKLFIEQLKEELDDYSVDFDDYSR